MHILLINNNPVVSRLLALCTRDVHMILEEVEDIVHLTRKSYDVVFVDEALYEGEIQNLSVLLTMQKKILLSNVDIDIRDFDMTIKKPFLPSQIIDVLENIDDQDVPTDSSEVLEVKNEAVEEVLFDTSTKVLNRDEIEKIKALLDMNENTVDEPKEDLSEEEYENRKIEAIKDQLKAEGLEIVDEDEILDAFSVGSVEEKLTIASMEKTALKKEKRKSVKKKKKKKEMKKNFKFKEDELERIKDAIEMTIASLKKKQIKKLLKGNEIEITLSLKGNK